MLLRWFGRTLESRLAFTSIPLSPFAHLPFTTIQDSIVATLHLPVSPTTVNEWRFVGSVPLCSSILTAFLE
jgi:hypothetical protein